MNNNDTSDKIWPQIHSSQPEKIQRRKGEIQIVHGKCAENIKTIEVIESRQQKLKTHRLVKIYVHQYARCSIKISIDQLQVMKLLKLGGQNCVEISLREDVSDIVGDRSVVGHHMQERPGAVGGKLRKLLLLLVSDLRTGCIMQPLVSRIRTLIHVISSLPCVSNFLLPTETFYGGVLGYPRDLVSIRFLRKSRVILCIKLSRRRVSRLQTSRGFTSILENENVTRVCFKFSYSVLQNLIEF